MGSVISESQTAFVKGRQILDGILIANEAVDEARRSKKELLLFKVDFEKAYDSVDWGYLDAVMGKMGFPTLWRKWIKECVCTATASVLVNGSPTDEFPLERGLRQGDPLSPFLFLLAAEGLHVLMEAMVERNLFTGYSVGDITPVSVSHLQFADDTLLLGSKSWANVRALRAVLVLFESMSGLRVNFNKSLLVGVNIPDSWLVEAASVLCCKVGKIPFLYLGLPIGGDPRRLGFWEPVVNRLKNRLSGWRSRFLSYGGRLVLLKSVLSSLPVYSLSFFKAPSGTISSIEAILIKFFWGGCEDLRKISWINWKTICLRKEYGGLGVRQLKEFNLALLGKWCWRMLVDKEGLWFRVLAGRYGVERGRLRVGGTRGSTWWRELARIRDGGGALEGGWFGGHISRKVGDGSDTFFWTDPWVDGTTLRERFGRLFDLAENKSASVAEMFVRGWGTGGEAWVWRRQLRAWEEELLGECQSLLLTISLQDHVSDRWQWQPDPDDGYTVRGTYQLLTAQAAVTLDAAAGLIWHPQVPLKVSILAWRLLRDRLPTKANLVTRAILSSEDHLCVSGCGEVETAQHLFLSCSTFGALWSLVSSWIGSSLVTAQTLSDHFVQFTGSAGGLRARHSFMQLIWLACVWVVWTERNNRLFRGSANSLHCMLDKIKTFSF
ncbi:putative non-LTR retroelement reverse transcriptase, partial [Trifolium medium]|nr:putative non-LTR retroelement reverse transcriptase [Trifolium medium]